MVTAALVMTSVAQTVLIPATTSWVVMPTTHVHKAVVTNLDSVDLDRSFDFCGTTSEFCGKKTVKQPSCNNSTHTLERVVGYYETWSTRRRCKQFWPEQIPLGVYTHINVAFAVIDPDTFEVRPSLTADIELFKRVARLKQEDPDLKVYIAIGGWSYNDPGPTATTFSDLAASTSNQNKFFNSLTKFMSTYDLDGVDIDWEYPAADDRSGRPEDFDNFPKFLKNLKAALKRTGGRDGLSITLPASFWYLQHFDIGNMKKSVDFFNIMTYDLHGTWDKGNKWTGEFLDAHTNLTEIKASLDLLWRNNIPPDQVVLGIAFYGRAYTIADPSCTKPGCLFASGAEAGDCSHEVGILMNSEIDEIIAGKRPRITYDKDAAVKMITWDDNQWVSYDDIDTFKLKADFARGKCLGGLMVWAVSHDHTNGTYSLALGEAAQRKFKALPDTIKTDDTIKIKHDQCKWTNCGDLCPDGWVLLRRHDDDRHHDGEWMLDDGGCIFKNQDHRLCCPPDQDAPTCGWYTFNNGDCEGKCPDGSFELGGTDRGCSTAFGNYQAACCTSGQKSTALYEKCEWGASFECDSWKCPAEKTDVLLKSCNGNGGSACGGDWRTNLNEERKYCCDSSDENMTFDDCEWLDDYSETGYQVIPADGGSGSGGSGYCFSSCPKDKVRVAMEHYNTCNKKTGSRAKCCSPNYTTTQKKVDPMVELWTADLKNWLENPTCSTGYGYGYDNTFGVGYDKRGFTDMLPIEYAPRYAGTSGTSLEKRQDQQVLFMSNSILIVATDIIYTYRMTSRTNKAVKEIKVWNEVIAARYTYLATSTLIPFLRDATGELFSVVAEDLAGRIICNLEYWNQMIKDCTAPSTLDEFCAISDLDGFDDEYSIDPDTYGTNGASTKRAFHSLDKRDGAPRDFTVDCGTDPITGQQRIMIITSVAYPNGGNGNNLANANGLTVRFAVANQHVCTDTSIDPNAPNNLWTWVTEHIFELQLIPRSIEFMVTGTLPAVQGLPDFSTGSKRMPWDIAQLLNQDYSTWASGHTTATGTPIIRIFDSLGSKINPARLVNTETHLNSMKGRLFAGKQPLGDDTWRNLNVADERAGRAVINEIRMVIAVFEYLNQQLVNRHLVDTYGAANYELRVFQKAVNSVFGQRDFSAPNLFRTFMTNFMRRMAEWASNWLNSRIDELLVTWQAVQNAATPGSHAYQVATTYMGDLEELKELVRLRVIFDDSIFVFMHTSGS
ncbi:glycoside hydrolase family 18 protein [Aspergillus luchuensis]|uniref:chitinase n=1 Tax=Aspergillus kawachii TaxID=1069201 RepID=A0A7R8A4S5_ASPKA|nr:uncharacterized protein AKAW2_71071A [Aspergillus luchuensis]BCS04193.1 hypothetical protein AKAW2_71071A [Aspergillus luchuensis]